MSLHELSLQGVRHDFATEQQQQHQFRGGYFLLTPWGRGSGLPLEEEMFLSPPWGSGLPQEERDVSFTWAMKSTWGLDGQWGRKMSGAGEK